ncbi:MAG: sulfurtransferase TusA family protein [Rhodoferax sp.]|jgi:tRNA 2-thiouridine synthesizing protein A|uniref:sulfurtransferase TusA family protein n=1 Tax=Rhodoferax sp. TaxID=50421 RepID=UPI001B65D0AC|nr:sulfurtransferase TusA family protein [Rhodoferax sp.]MBP9147688.1 sulfurtransferase TusA family protein [Rhodoferax sp.]MBP9734849.1 sulfurtransferase TusA family protein [Rhodoferax sp.]
MNASELKALSIGKLIDARGTACPGPMLEAKRAIGEVAVGGAMEVQSSDSGTIVDIQRWCKKMGHEYLGDVENDGFWSVYLRRKV